MIMRLVGVSMSSHALSTLRMATRRVGAYRRVSGWGECAADSLCWAMHLLLIFMCVGTSHLQTAWCGGVRLAGTELHLNPVRFYNEEPIFGLPPAGETAGLLCIF